mmetsp:Transcript_11274/g.22273  ORF Transcript_11274/g.22273 Transcript_11274/m.22273 type:complete len:229 (+) Transcript_11274:134-820(+)
MEEVEANIKGLNALALSAIVKHRYSRLVRNILKQGISAIISSIVFLFSIFTLINGVDYEREYEKRGYSEEVQLQNLKSNLEFTIYFVFTIVTLVCCTCVLAIIHVKLNNDRENTTCAETIRVENLYRKIQEEHCILSDFCEIRVYFKKAPCLAVIFWLVFLFVLLASSYEIFSLHVTKHFDFEETKNEKITITLSIIGTVWSFYQFLGEFGMFLALKKKTKCCCCFNC